VIKCGFLRGAVFGSAVVLMSPSSLAVYKSKKSWLITILASADTFVLGSNNGEFVHICVYDEVKNRTDVEI